MHQRVSGLGAEQNILAAAIISSRTGGDGVGVEGAMVGARVGTGVPVGAVVGVKVGAPVGAGV